jgi:hypothetical protein
LLTGSKKEKAGSGSPIRPHERNGPRFSTKNSSDDGGAACTSRSDGLDTSRNADDGSGGASRSAGDASDDDAASACASNQLA